MNFLQPYLILSVLIFSLMLLLWLVSLWLKNSGIVDIFWGTGFVIFTWVAFPSHSRWLHDPQTFALRAGDDLGFTPVDPPPPA